MHNIDKWVYVVADMVRAELCVCVKYEQEYEEVQYPGNTKWNQTSECWV